MKSAAAANKNTEYCISVGGKWSGFFAGTLSLKSSNCYSFGGRVPADYIYGALY